MRSDGEWRRARGHMGQPRMARMVGIGSALLCWAASAGTHADAVVPVPKAQVTRTVVDPIATGEAEKNGAASAAPSTAAGAAEVPSVSLPGPAHSTSLGSPTNGQLRGGVPLPMSAPGVRYNDRRSENARFATVEVLRAIVKAADVVRRELPGSELVVNDLSLAHGGPIAHHGSHRAGRDADILFYLLGDDGRPTPSVGAPIDPDGIGFDYKDLSIAEDDLRVHFDAARTWRFVRALIENPEAPVQRIFVAEHLRTLLLKEGERVKAPAETLARFAELTCQPSYPHDDHLHVRWYCSAEDIGHGCEDLPPIYPWHEQELAEQGLKPVLAHRTKSRNPAPIETNAEADAAVLKQKPHPSVLAFLARRKAWQDQPHPGRQYCR